MPSLRHLAIRCENPPAMADFYKTVFDLQEVWRDSRVVYLSDGVVNLALLPPLSQENPAEGAGINHFGFVVDSIQEIQQRLALAEVPPAAPRPQDGRRYAEWRACDLEGNAFDLSEAGWTLEAPPPAPKPYQTISEPNEDQIARLLREHGE